MTGRVSLAATSRPGQAAPVCSCPSARLKSANPFQQHRKASMTRNLSGTAGQLEAALMEAFAPLHLEIEDDSARHAGHAAAGGGGHFNVTLVSAAFNGRSMLEQHRMVNAVLKEFIGGSVHALGLRTVPAVEWPQGEDAS